MFKLFSLPTLLLASLAIGVVVSTPLAARDDGCIFAPNRYRSATAANMRGASSFRRLASSARMRIVPPWKACPGFHRTFSPPTICPRLSIHPTRTSSLRLPWNPDSEVTTAVGTYIVFSRWALPNQSCSRSVMFDHCSNFVIKGGTFNTLGRPREPEYDADYRAIRVGDINLLSLVTENEIFEHRVVRHRKRPGRIRREWVVTGRRQAYHARIFGSQEVFTAVVYEDVDFSSLKLKVAKQSFPRNPNITQLFGITHSSPMSALIYQDELLPLSTALAMCTSYMSMQLLKYQIGSQYTRLMQDYENTLSPSIESLEKEEWFRVSTGQLCIEICEHPTDFVELLYCAHTGRRLGSVRVLDPSGCVTVPDLMRVMSLDDVLEVLAYNGHWKHESFTHGRLYLGGLYPYCSDDHLGPLAIVPSSITVDLGLETTFWNCGYIMPNGWTRICLHDLLTSQSRACRDPEAPNFPERYHYFGSSWTSRMSVPDTDAMGITWLTHASEFVGHPCERYFLVSSIHFRVELCYWTDDASLRGTFMADAPMDDIYLCVFTPQFVRQDGFLSVDFPPIHESYYWSFNEDGSEPLTVDELEDILPPEVDFSLVLSGPFWNEQDYRMIEEFKMAMGRNAES
ncbi:hypothetical protein MVEN_00858800 [Mycena venus]|uniref:Uncharacterized protein n=1 Tax=Mycena venus TaxID=2733690 RepID=A0A8H7D3J5_9AGAR|nr:hypothetical protein MVEN_00858800 [Mycena venus]